MVKGYQFGLDTLSSLADNNVERIGLRFIANEDSELRYLIEGSLRFENDKDVILDVVDKLK